MTTNRRTFVKTLFVASQAAFLGRIGSAATPAGALDPAGLNFIVFGDWGRHGQQDQIEVASQMARSATATGTKFIISVGDNFYEDGVASVDDPQWVTSFEKVYHAPSLQVPWYCVLGNHDYHGVPDAQIAYGQTHPRWIMPARYYTQVQRIDAQTEVEFFFLDTSPFIKKYEKNEKMRSNVEAQDPAKQVAWFRQALARSQARWKIVIAHHPIYSGGKHGDQPELIEAILPLLEPHGVQAYFNGHDHDLQHLIAGKVQLFDTGAGSEFRPTQKIPQTRYALATSGFTQVSLTRERMQVDLIDNNGTRLYTATVPVG